MPNFQPYAADFRADGYSTRIFMSAYVPSAPIAAGTITAVLSARATLLFVTYTTGAYTDVDHGMEVVITDPSGNFKGRTHISFDGQVISAAFLQTRELSLGTIDVQANDLFAVFTEWRLHDKLTAATAQFPPDYLTYTDQNLHPFPLACSGGHVAGQSDAGQTYMTAQMTGSTSIPVDPANTSGLTHLWTLPSGVAFASGSVDTDADPVLQVDVGKYVVDHAVTDADSGKTITQHVVLINDPAPYEVMLTADLQSDENTNWHYSVRLFQNATLDDLPDGSLVILWCQERLNGMWQSIRNLTPGRATILAVGYLHADTNTLDQAINTLTFDVVSIAQRLDEIAGYSKAMNEAATPDSWSKINTLTTMRAKIQLLMFYTTVIESGFDVIFDSTYVDYVYPTLYCQRSTPIQQLRELAHSVDARVMVDRTGQINIHLHPAYVPIGERASVTTTFTLALQDILHAEITRPHFDITELMKVSGFGAGSNPLPYFSLYPGNAPGEASSAQSYERLILDASTPQDDVNARAGRYGALIDSVFIDELNGGEKYRVGALTLTLRGSYDFFDVAYCNYVKLTLTGASNLRGFDFSALRWWVKGTQVTYGGGTAQTKVTLMGETNAAAGTSYFPPPSANLPPVTTPPLPPVTTQPPTNTNTGLIPGALNLYAFDVAHGVWAYNKTLGTWTNTISLSGLGMGGTLQSATWLTTGNVARLVTSTQERLLNNYSSGTPALGTAHSFAETSGNRQSNSERQNTHWSITATYVYSVGVVVDWSTDDTTFHRVTVTALYDTNATDAPETGLWLDGNLLGHALLSVFTTTGGAGSTAVCALYETFDYGATWSAKGISSGKWLANAIAVGYLDVSASTIYHGACDGTGGSGALFKLYKNGADISPQVSGTPYGFTQGQMRCISCCDNDPASLVVIAGSVSNSSVIGVFLSRNYGNNWTVLVAPSSSVKWRQAYFVDRNCIYLIGSSGAVGVWQPSTGIVDISIPSGGEIVSLMGK